MALKQTVPSPGVPPLDSSAEIQFAGFRLDVRGGLLLRGDERIPLRAKTWAVLRYLADRPGVLASKDELLDALWPDVAVTPDTLSKSIGELRVALSDDSQAPRIIETVHRRGFRFIAETRRAAQDDPLSGSAPPVLVGSHLVRADPSERPFVGRREERRMLAAAFARAQAGERQIVFVTGPSGVGKSALIDAFLGSIVGEPTAPVWIAHAGCFEHHGPLEPYLPVLESLERLARQPGAEPLLELMRRVAPMWLVRFPWLVGDADAEQLRRSLHGVGVERMSRELAVLVETLTTGLTLVLVLEDLHWSDPSTVDLLTVLARRREPARLLVIGSYRPAELAVHEHALASAVRTLRVERQCVEIPVGDLDEDAVRAYLAARFPGSLFPSALARLIHAHTGGHPLFMTGIVDHMRSRGWILETEPGWGLSTAPGKIDLGVPDDVRRMIETQLYRLSPSERGLLEAASVLAYEITAPVVAAALACEVAVAEQLCETLAGAQQFLHVAGTLEWLSGGVERRYAFTHELHRQVVYDEIPEGRRARLHQRVGEAIESAHGTRATEIAPLLAVHFERGRVPARALHYLIAAGARARRLGASREALGYLEPALSLVGLLPDTDERRRLELDLRLALGRSQGDIHGFAAEQVRENYERASVLCAALGAETELCEVLYARWYLHALRAERKETIALAAELDAYARRPGRAALGVLADSVLVRTALYAGRFADVRRHMESLLARHPDPADTPPRVGYGAEPAIAATMHYAIALWFLGDPEGARMAAASGLARARSSGDPFSLSAALMQAALVDLLCRHRVEGGVLAEQSAALAAEHGFTFWINTAMAMCGWARIQQGKESEGRDALEQALAAMQATGTRFFSAFLHAFLAEACLRAGAVADGLEHANAGLTLAETTLDCAYQPELWRLKGELLLASPAGARRRPKQGKRAGKPPAAVSDADWPESEQCLLRALELARAAQARSLELRAATSLARAWQARGRADEARELLAGICGWFDAGVGTADLIEARALLAELNSPRLPLPQGPRERDRVRG